MVVQTGKAEIITNVFIKGNQCMLLRIKWVAAVFSLVASELLYLWLCVTCYRLACLYVLWIFITLYIFQPLLNHPVFNIDVYVYCSALNICNDYILFNNFWLYCLNYLLSVCFSIIFLLLKFEIRQVNHC